MSSPESHLKEIKDLPSHEIFMYRCLQLALLATGYTAPNPMVGAVLVYEGRIIGEGFHEKHGGPHAEVHCIQSVNTADRHLIPFSILYISLEPCCHHGKTPPCTDLIIREKIPKVVVACRDPFPDVNGKGIEKLTANGVETIYPILEDQAMEINRRFFTFHLKKRPYVVLKWAQSANRKIAGLSGERIRISNTFSNRLVHKWRSEEAGILIGANTALTDNPELTTRLWKGKNPVRIVIDPHLRLPDSLKIFDGSTPSVVLNGISDLHAGQLLFKKINTEEPPAASVLAALHSLHILSVLVEGGAYTLQSFIDAGAWDEIRIITNHELEIPQGIFSPDLKNALMIREEKFESDTISYYKNLGV